MVYPSGSETEKVAGLAVEVGVEQMVTEVARESTPEAGRESAGEATAGPEAN